MKALAMAAAMLLTSSYGHASNVSHPQPTVRPHVQITKIPTDTYQLDFMGYPSPSRTYYILETHQWNTQDWKPWESGSVNVGRYFVTLMQGQSARVLIVGPNLLQSVGIVK